ncbi:di-trans,poly-cis-decaprenylcistransferase [Acidomonas methanolica]|uniref:Isoprenyl transferase n=2 Tax=Acidomonas methanolica TaxID=437 RepID=A0A023D8X2_ACIMT|nr:polyprenyl diphosphate synthase [Acidomonas methanolica]MBU2653881.1 di-trans,poly-cis-decaprenylcistransferase [Acidomonas methanolica]TCS30841.1 undecaprenyl diphosphate synthase [Acidomonas methanolica]GAJ30627.1 undecaprenyl pyrophosphate synthase [Acidomonas methanolica NBRC 104435]GBQ58371.1 undecaprenyl pyrophosphate synthetase [Acidomonas methanolica]GEK98362.1 isoprenyl transferase [Acidomonas methanolica NBRC 104435]
MPRSSLPAPSPDGSPEETPLRGGVRAPLHVAIIMDGNGRWAKARGLPVYAGHRAGAEAVRRCVRAAIQHGVRYVTLYAFSSENWRREPQEIGDLTNLLRYYLRHKVTELHEQDVQLRVIGEVERFEPELREEMARAEALTLNNTRLTLVLALSYGGRADIVQAARRMAEAGQRGEIDLNAAGEADFSCYLLTGGMPDPDLVVRTSGEYRLSNFLLWQCAYAELAFLDVLWPDFTERHFAALLADFARRERRFGGR